MSSQSLLGELRSLLNQNTPDTQRALEILRSWPDVSERGIGARYLQDHLRQHSARVDLVQRRAPEDARLRFDPSSRRLSKPDGTVLKEMCCPLEKQWDDLRPGDTDLTRHCVSCHKRVVNTAGLDPDQVHLLVRYDPEVCLYIDVAHGNLAIRVDDAPPERTIVYEWSKPDKDLPVIRTARTRVEINLGAMIGERPLVKRVEPTNGRITSFMQVWQNRVSGEISVQSDVRYPGFHENPEDWTLVLENLQYDETLHLPEPFAAYLVPPDLVVGELVWLEDVIENFIGSVHHGAYRLRGVEAIWTGDDFDVQYDESTDVTYYLG